MDKFTCFVRGVRDGMLHIFYSMLRDTVFFPIGYVIM